MKVIGLRSIKQAAVLDKPYPQRKGKYHIVKVEVAPMCNEHIAYSDWIFRDRNRPDSLGHEAAGVVVEAPQDSHTPAGTRVVALPGYPCGVCHMCVAGAYAHCLNPDDPRAICDSPSGESCFAEYILKAGPLLIPIPDYISLDHASMLCCGMGASFTALRRMNCDKNDVVLITGLGQVGLGAIINAKGTGARVLAVSKNPYRRNLATTLGADMVFDPSIELSLDDAIKQSGFPKPSIGLECSAQVSYQRLQLDTLNRGAELTLLGESGELTIHCDNDIIQKGLTLRGSLDIYLDDVPAALDLISKNTRLIDKLITHRFPLNRIEEAWNIQLSGECGKILLYP